MSRDLLDYFAAKIAASLAPHVSSTEALVRQSFDIAEAMVSESEFRRQASSGRPSASDLIPEEAELGLWSALDQYDRAALLDQPMALEEETDGDEEVDPSWEDRAIDPAWDRDARGNERPSNRPGLARTEPQKTSEGSGTESKKGQQTG